MSIEENKQLARNVWTAVADARWAVVEDAYAQDVAYHGSGPTELRGREQVVGLAKGYKAAFPDMRFSIEQVIAEGDLVMTRVRATGTNTGELMGMPAAGKKAEVFVINVIRVVKGKVVEEWETFDQLDFMRQLGHIPAGG